MLFKVAAALTYFVFSISVFLNSFQFANYFHLLLAVSHYQDVALKSLNLLLSAGLLLLVLGALFFTGPLSSQEGARLSWSMATRLGLYFAFACLEGWDHSELAGLLLLDFLLHVAVSGLQIKADGLWKSGSSIHTSAKLLRARLLGGHLLLFWLLWELTSFLESQKAGLIKVLLLGLLQSGLTLLPSLLRVAMLNYESYTFERIKHKHLLNASLEIICQL
jgi:hypothetical protein